MGHRRAISAIAAPLATAATSATVPLALALAVATAAPAPAGNAASADRRSTTDVALPNTPRTDPRVLPAPTELWD